MYGKVSFILLDVKPVQVGVYQFQPFPYILETNPVRKTFRVCGGIKAVYAFEVQVAFLSNLGFDVNFNVFGLAGLTMLKCVFDKHNQY